MVGLRFIQALAAIEEQVGNIEFTKSDFENIHDMLKFNGEIVTKIVDIDDNFERITFVCENGEHYEIKYDDFDFAEWENIFDRTFNYCIGENEMTKEEFFLETTQSFADSSSETIFTVGNIVSDGCNDFRILGFDLETEEAGCEYIGDNDEGTGHLVTIPIEQLYLY